MDNLIDNPAFNTYALCVAILVIKSFHLISNHIAA